MEINEESVKAYLAIISDPAKYQLSFRRIQECFEKSEIVTAKHLLADSYIVNEATELPKIFCYIIMDEIFGQCDGKDSNGDLGYHLKYKPKEDDCAGTFYPTFFNNQ